MDERLVRIDEAASFIREKLGGRKPFALVVLGSGLGKLADSVENAVVIPYTTIPHFVKSTAVGHKGNLICGELGGKFICAMQGRFHYYEGYQMEQVTFPVRVMKRLGAEYMFVSNAAGGVNFDYKIGDLMIIKDHISMFPNPLIGKNLDELGPRFVDMTRPYDLSLIKKMEEIAAEKGIILHKGVYLGNTGPTYETPAEYKFYRTAGADAVGMSTIPEVIVARHAGITVFGMSVITNEAHDDYAADYVNDPDEVVDAANASADKMGLLFTTLLQRL
ncbi:MAG: purine-nucleoside phosphorylase [Bacteroidales bacterium]|nr:purine-nucleoside phosphorylase [Bacteroidales bacterium]